MITQDFLSINKFHRSGRARLETRLVVLHWVANPRQSAKSVRDYFESLKGPDTYASAHYVVGLLGEIVQCMPEKELAFHAGSSQIEPASGQVYTDFAREQLGKVYTSPKSSPNYCTIGVEMCHPDWGGEPTPATRQALIELFADICIRNNLDPMSQITTHHAIVGWKDCPRFFTNHPDEFIAFKTAVRSEVYRRK